MDISLKRFSIFVRVRSQDTGVYQSKANVVREIHIIFTSYYIHSADIRCQPSTNRRHRQVTIGNSRPADGHKSIVGRSWENSADGSGVVTVIYILFQVGVSQNRRCSGNAQRPVGWSLFYYASGAAGSTATPPRPKFPR